MRIKSALIGAAALAAAAIPVAANAQTVFSLGISSGGYYDSPYGYDYGYAPGYYDYPSYGYAYPSGYYRYDRGRHWDHDRRGDGRWDRGDHGDRDHDGDRGRHDGWRDGRGDHHHDR